ncbi:MAG TPA: hypothetical protein VKV21_05595 [Solirubrobacteraceae bacterium]|nr:hypothetical protein [Solirubrobacteraceae bacterium]
MTPSLTISRAAERIRRLYGELDRVNRRLFEITTDVPISRPTRP